MAFVDWSDQLNTGIPSVDEQHKNLVNLLNNLHQAMLSRQAKEQMGEILDRLIDYTDYHFKHEEEFMEEINYDQLEEHKELHEKIIVENLHIFIRFRKKLAFIDIRMRCAEKRRMHLYSLDFHRYKT